MAGKKENNRKSGAARRNKERKQDEAIIRQGRYDRLSALEKLSLIESRRGNSAKEKNRLLALVA